MRVRLGRHDVGRDNAAAPSPEGVQRGIRGDPVQPCPQVGAGLEAVAGAPRPQECLLDDVLGIVERAEHPVGVDVEAPPLRLDHVTERGGIASADCVDHARAAIVAFQALHDLFTDEDGEAAGNSS